MITVNEPFIIALIIIIFLAVIKWLEWYLFQNGALPRRTRRRRVKDSIGGNRLRRIKELLFFKNSDLKRPWYAGMPFAAFIIIQSLLLNRRDPLQTYQIFLVFFFGIAAAVCLDVLFMLKANKTFFSERNIKMRYIRSQMAQLLLSVFLGILIAGAMIIYDEIKSKDPPELAKEVNWVIKPEYQGRWPQFSEGLAPVAKDGKYGFINKQGNVSIAFQFDEANDFCDGMAAVRKGRKWGFINQSGQKVIPFLYDEVIDFGDGLAPVRAEGKWVVIDRSGTVSFKTDFLEMSRYHEGVSKVVLEDDTYRAVRRDNLIDTEGKLLFRKDYRFDLSLDSEFNEGCMPVCDYSNKKREIIFLDKNEQKTIPYEFSDAGSFRNGCAPVMLLDGSFALIDHRGNTVRKLTEDEFYDYSSYREGLALFSKGRWNASQFSGDSLRYGFKDSMGNVLIPAEFKEATYSSEGLIGLKVDNKWGFIENPIPAAARTIDLELWKKDRTQIAIVEGRPVYAGELELAVHRLKERNPALTGIPAYKMAFDQIKSEKAFEKYGIRMDENKIQYQIGDSYYRRLLLKTN